MRQPLPMFCANPLRVAASLTAALLIGCAPKPHAETSVDSPAPDNVAETAVTDASLAPNDTRGSQQSSAPPAHANEQLSREHEQLPSGSDAGSASTDSPRVDAATPYERADSAPSPPLDAALASASSTHDAAVVADCYTEFSKSHAAVTHQRAVFLRSDYNARPAMIKELADAAAAYPKEEQFVLLSGLMRLWRILEPTDVEAVDVLDILDTLTKTEQDLQRAYELCPTDHRIAAWLGPLWVKMGRALGDTEKVEAGIAIMEQGAERYPEFVTFPKLLADSVLPASHPGFQRALGVIKFYRDLCDGERLHSGCLTGPMPPHNFEGTGLYFGDTLAKAQDREGALAWYTNAKQAPDYANWKYRDRIEQRIKTIDKRIAAAKTPDTADDEPFWDTEPQCSLCHRE